MTPSPNGKGKKTLFSSLLSLILLVLLALGQKWLMPMISPEAEAPSVTAAAVATSAPAESAASEPEEKTGPIIAPQDIADYLFAHGQLPDNFITKNQAKQLGWDNQQNYVSDAAPGKSIGGDRYGNYEGTLPVVKGRTYYEADANYVKGRRSAQRIVYSTDGHVYYTEDHYATFTELFPTFQGDTAPLPWRGGQ